MSEESGILPAFVQGVKGMKIGDRKILTVSAKDAYGEKTVEVPKADLEAAMKDG